MSDLPAEQASAGTYNERGRLVLESRLDSISHCQINRNFEQVMLQHNEPRQ